MAKMEKLYCPKEILAEFSENATPHGPGLIKNAKTTTGKAISIFILLTCIAAAFINIGIQLNSFFEFRYKDTIRVDNSVIMMPSVTICPAGGYSRMQYITYNFSESSSTTEWMAIPLNYELLQKNSHLNFSNYKDIMTKGRIVFDNISPEERVKIGHDLDGLIIKCYFANRDCNTSHFGQFLHHDLNHCYTFNGADVQMNTDTQVKATTTEAGLHLKVFLDAYIPEILPFGSVFSEDVLSSGNIGLRVTIHPPGTKAFPNVDGFDIAPGYASTVMLKQHKMERLGHPYGDCTNQKLLKGTSYAYSIAGCRAQCFQRHIMQKCGCASSWHPIPANNTLDICTVMDAKNINKELIYIMNVSDTRADMDILSKDFTRLGCFIDSLKEIEGNTLECKECLPPCVEISYSKSISQAYWPDEAIQGYIIRMILKSPERNTRGQQMINRYMNFSEIEKNKYQVRNRTHADVIRKNMVSLSISFNDLTTEVTEQQIEYDGAQLLCDIGGALGIYIGASFISLCEVGKLLTQLCKYAFCRKNTSKIDGTS